MSLSPSAPCRSCPPCPSWPASARLAAPVEQGGDVSGGRGGRVSAWLCVPRRQAGALPHCLPEQANNALPALQARASISSSIADSLSCSFSICPWCPLGTDRWWLHRMATCWRERRGVEGVGWEGARGHASESARAAQRPVGRQAASQPATPGSHALKTPPNKHNAPPCWPGCTRPACPPPSCRPRAAPRPRSAGCRA